MDLICCVRIFSSLEVKVEAGHHTVAGQVAAVRRQANLFEPGVLVVKGETRPAGHERVVTVAEDVVVNVTKGGRSQRIGLLRHSDPLRALKDDQLRVLYP